MPRHLAPILTVLLASCALSSAEETVTIVAEEPPPEPAPARPTSAFSTQARPAPGAIPSRAVRPRCTRLADDSGWACTPAATSPEELARLIAEAEGARVEAGVPAQVDDVARANIGGAHGVAYVQLEDTSDAFGALLTFVALEGPGGWGFAADAGTLGFGVNGAGTARMVAAGRDETTGLVRVDAAWHHTDAACTEPLSWTLDESRSTVCDLSRATCRTLPTERVEIEAVDGSPTARHGFRARLELAAGGKVSLRRLGGRLPRAARGLGRSTRLASLPVHVDPFSR